MEEKHKEKTIKYLPSLPLEKNEENISLTKIIKNITEKNTIARMGDNMRKSLINWSANQFFSNPPNGQESIKMEFKLKIRNKWSQKFSLMYL
jgi:hypothetical protein